MSMAGSTASLLLLGVGIISTLLPHAVDCGKLSDQGHGPNLFCYYGSYSQSRPEEGKFLPEDINPDLCTHIVFAFADLVQGSTVSPGNWNDLPSGKEKGLYARTQDLKKKNPSLKFLLAIGGWRVGSEPFTAMVGSEENRKGFIRNAIKYLRKHNFDGLDMDWEFPGTRGSSAEDKVLYTGLIRDMQDAFGREAEQTGKDKLLLTMAVSGGSYYINLAYEPKKIVRYVDFLLLMAYNYHGSWNEYTGHHSGLFSRSDEASGEREWNQAWSIDFWLNQAGIPKEKLILGIATYGMTYTLADTEEHGLKAATTGAGSQGKYTQEAGILAFYEICDNLKNGWTSEWIEEQKVPYAHHDGQWVGYDNVDSVAYKAHYVLKKGLGGAFIWSVENDDFKGSCGEGKYPLLSSIARVLQGGGSGGDEHREDRRSTHRSSDDEQEEGRNADHIGHRHTDHSDHTSRRSGSASQSILPSSRNSDRRDVKGSDVQFGRPSKNRALFRQQPDDEAEVYRKKTIRGKMTDADILRDLNEREPGSRISGTSSDGGGSRFSGASGEVGRSRYSSDSGDGFHHEDSFSNQRTKPTGREDRYASEDVRGSFNPPGSRKSTSEALDKSSHNFNSGQDHKPHTRSKISGIFLSEDVPSQDFAYPTHEFASKPSNQFSGRSSQKSDDEGHYGADTTQLTNTTCEHPGIYPQPGSCRAYYICVLHGPKWFKFRLSCPQGFGFKPDVGTCGPVDNCYN